MNDKTSRILMIFAAFLSGLVLFFVAILFVTGRTSSSIGVAAVGGSLDNGGATVAGGMVFVNSGYGRITGQPGNLLLAFAVPSSNNGR